jgi:hypothetical protein
LQRVGAVPALAFGVDPQYEHGTDDERDHRRDQQQRERPQARAPEGDQRVQRGNDADGTDRQRHPRTAPLHLPDDLPPPQQRLPIDAHHKRPVLTHRPRLPHVPQRPKMCGL